MSDWYEVNVTIVKTFAVECDSQEESLEIVEDIITCDFEDIESSIITEDWVEQALRHTDKDKIISLT